MQSPSNKSITSEAESGVSTPTSSKSSDSQHVASSSLGSPSPEKTTSKLLVKNEIKDNINNDNINKKLNNKNIMKPNLPSSTTEQTPTRFLAACSKLDLEPNPFEQSFSGAATNPEETGQNTPKQMLPSVSQLTSPSPAIRGDDYWSISQSLRNGPLSPSMLEAPQEPIIFDSTRTGTTPLSFGSYTEQPQSTRSPALFGAAASGNLQNSYMNPPISVLNLTAVATAANLNNNSDPFGRNVFPPQGVLIDQGRKNISAAATTTTTTAPASSSTTASASSKTIKPSINPVSSVSDNNNISSTQPAIQTTLSNVSTNIMITNQIGNQQDTTVVPKPEKDRYNISNPNNPITILQNNSNINNNNNDINTTSTSQKNIIINHQSSSFDQEPSSPQDKINNKSMSRRRKTDDFPINEQSPAKKNNQKTKNELTDEEKRKNFLERNRQAALKCRQRKKQWLANLQAKVEYLTNDNENLQNQAQSLREEIFNLKTLLLAHKDCPITQANGGLTLDTITSGINGIPPPNMTNINGVPINVGVGLVHNHMQTSQNPGIQPNGVGVQLQVPQNISGHVPPGSGMNLSRVTTSF